MDSKRLQVPVIGLRRSGKSSLLNVVYNDLHPDDTLFLESTTKSVFFNSDSFLPIRVIDMPGGILLGNSKLEKGLPLTAAAMRIGTHPGLTRAAASSTQSSDSISPSSSYLKSSADILSWTDVSAVVFVIDAQDDYFEALSKLHSVILSAFAENQTIDFHVFVHKSDAYSEDYRQDTLSTIRGKVLDDLMDSSSTFVAQPWSYLVPPSKTRKESKARSKSRDPHLSRSPANGNNSASGGYDASASEFSLFPGAGSKPSHDFQPEPGQINLEQAVHLHCHATSIYDTSVFVAFSKLQQTLMQKVKSQEPNASHSENAAPPSSSAATVTQQSTSKSSEPVVQDTQQRPAAPATSERVWTLASSVETLCDSICSSCKLENAILFDLPTRTYVGSDSTPFDASAFEVIFDYAVFLSKFAGLYANLRHEPDSIPLSSSPGSTKKSASKLFFPATRSSFASQIQADNSNHHSQSTRYASSVSRLVPDKSLAFWQITERLALIALIQTETHTKQTGLIGYNVCFFRRAIQKLYLLAQSTFLSTTS